MNSTLDEPGSFKQAKLPEFRPWKELAIISQLVMELAWIVPWYRSLTYGTNQASSWRVFSILFGILLITYFFVRGMNYFHLRVKIRRVSFVIFSILVLFFALRFLLYFSEPMSLFGLVQRPILAFADLVVLIPDEFVILVFVLFILFRGISIAGQGSSPRDMIVRFQVGLGMMMLYVAINTLLTAEIPGNSLYMFLFSGLIAIGAARMSVNEKMRGGRETSFDRRWLAGMIFSAMLAVLAAIVVSQIVGQEFFNSFLLILGAIGKILIGLFLLLLFPIIVLLLYILDWLNSQSRLAEILPEIFTNLQDMISQLDGIAYRILETVSQYLPDLSFTKPFWLWGVVLSVIILGLLFASFQWLVRNYTKLNEEDLGSILDQNSFAKLLKYIFLRQLKSLGERLDQKLNSSLSQRKKAAAHIRRIYQELCELGESQGAVRPEAWTPLEYLPQLEKVFPEHTDGVRQITLAYNKIRYGEYPEDLQEIQEIIAIWLGIQSRAKDKKSPTSDSKKVNH
jgi:hypothetical protein